jgi:hypothetical protein
MTTAGRQAVERDGVVIEPVPANERGWPGDVRP